jgi:hypothetical protein
MCVNFHKYNFSTSSSGRNYIITSSPKQNDFFDVVQSVSHIEETKEPNKFVDKRGNKSLEKNEMEIKIRNTLKMGWWWWGNRRRKHKKISTFFLVPWRFFRLSNYCRWVSLSFFLKKKEQLFLDEEKDLFLFFFEKNQPPPKKKNFFRNY